MFERVVEACIAAGLVGGEGFAVDASLIQADANKQRSIAGQDWRRDRDPARSSRAVKEYLATLDDTAWGAASEVVPKFVSPSDPAAQWTGAHKGPAFFAYSDNYLIDVKFGVIVDVEASRAIRQAEVGAAKTMIERTEERFGLKPERLVGDTAYGAAPMLNWLVEEKGIAPHIPVFDKSKRDDGTFSRSDFRYDPTDDVYHCPGGKRLGTSGTVHEGKTLLYRASKLDCDVCPLKPQCCPKEPSRKIPRDIHEHARDVARSFAGTEGFEQSRRERKKIEMRFAHLKRILKLGRLRLRGPRGAQDEFVLAAIAQNLRRLASLVARPPPAAGPVYCVAWELRRERQGRRIKAGRCQRNGRRHPSATADFCNKICQYATSPRRAKSNELLHAPIVPLLLVAPNAFDYTPTARTVCRLRHHVDARTRRNGEDEGPRLRRQKSSRTIAVDHRVEE